jgi:hypothetical protein
MDTAGQWIGRLVAQIVDGSSRASKPLRLLAARKRRTCRAQDRISVMSMNPSSRFESGQYPLCPSDRAPHAGGTAPWTRWGE